MGGSAECFSEGAFDYQSEDVYLESLAAFNRGLLHAQAQNKHHTYRQAKMNSRNPTNIAIKFFDRQLYFFASQ